ncbi:MAG TPA: hypothetical protein VGR73_00925 [Bryobacteraceae bacterium]|nr:hypothetical protein [Bryobacteraceae bacterium]
MILPPLVPPYVLCLVLLWTAASVWTAHGGQAHPEISIYLPYHLSDVPLIKRVFDSKVLNGGDYQARELSYAVDALDCHFIAWSARHGFPHFLSLTNYICTIAIALILWRFLAVDLQLDRAAAGLLMLLFLTSPFVFFSSSYFRSAKILVTLALIVLIRQLHRGLTNVDTSGKRWLPFGIVALAATLCDPQGFFFVLLIASLLGIYVVVRKAPSAAAALVAAAAAVAISRAYNYALAPYLTLWLNGYWPDFSFQSLPWSQLLNGPLSYSLVGGSLLLDTTRFEFGDLPALWPLLLLEAGILAIAIFRGRLWGVIATLAVLGLVVLNTLMVLRHPPLVWADVRRAEYFTPGALVLSALFGFALAAAAPRLHPVWMRVALACALLANIAQLPAHQAVLSSGSLKDQIPLSAALRRALLTGQPEPGIADHPLYKALAPPENRRER